MINKKLMENEQIKKILSALTCFDPESINSQLLALVCNMDWENDKESIWEHIVTLDNYSILEIQAVIEEAGASATKQSYRKICAYA